MNPRYRRLLIPGLLIAILVVVVLVSIARRADGATPDAGTRATEVSRISDPRITESSGLAVSRTHADLAYTVNDSGNTPTVYAIRISTGAVVGATQVSGVTWRDTEALALGPDDTLWIADTGDNDRVRQDAALYSLPEPGPGDGTATAKRYPVSYGDGPDDVEAMAVQPDTGRTLLLGKGLLGGAVYRLPTTLRPDAPNIASTTSWVAPGLTTGAAYLPDGRTILVRTYSTAQVRDARTWRLLRTDRLPQQPQGESIAPEPSGKAYLVGSEGRDSALFRLVLSDAPSPTPTPTPTRDEPRRGDRGSGRPAWLVPVGGLGAVVVLAGVAAWVSRRR